MNIPNSQPTHFDFIKLYQLLDQFLVLISIFPPPPPFIYCTKISGLLI